MNDKQGNIDDLIRDGFGSSSDDFDFGSWSDMKKKLDTNIGLDQQIVQAFDVTPEEVPVAAWPEISEKLDIDTVWSRIDAKMSKKKRRAFIWWNAAAIGLLLLLAGYVFQDEFTNKERVRSGASATIDNNESIHATNTIENSDIISDLEHIELNDQNGSNIVNANFETSDILESDENVDFIVESQRTHNINADNETLIELNVDLNNNVTIDQNAQVSTTSLELIQPLNSSPIIKLCQANFDTELPEIEIKPIEEKPLFARRWIAGAFGSVNNSIISDATTREAFSSNSLVSNNFTVSMSYGVYGQFYTKKNYFIQSEFYWSSKVKRSSQEYEHFQNIKRLVELDYYKLTLNAGKSISVGKKKHTWFNPSIGGFVSYLKRSEEYRETTLIGNDTHHRNWNYGVHLNLGVQHEFNRVVLGYGINSSIGLANIFEGTEQQSSFLNVSKTYTNGLYLRLGFKL